MSETNNRSQHLDMSQTPSMPDAQLGVPSGEMASPVKESCERLDSADGSLAESMAQISRLKAMEKTLGKAVDDWRKQLEDLGAACAQVEADKLAAEQELSRIKSEIRAMRDNAESVRSEIDSGRANLASEQKNLDARREELLSAEKRHEEMIAAFTLEKEMFQCEMAAMRQQAVADAAREKSEIMRKIEADATALRLKKMEEADEEQRKLAAALDDFLGYRRKDALESLEKELGEARQRAQAEVEASARDVRDLRAAVERDRADLENRRLLVERREVDVVAREKILEMRESELDEEIGRRTEEIIKGKQAELDVQKQYCEELREKLKSDQLTRNQDELLRHLLGDRDPAAIIGELRTNQKIIRGLKEELARRPGEELRILYDEKSRALKEETARYNELVEKYEKMPETEQMLLAKSAEIGALNEEKERLEQRFKLLETHNAQLEKELERFRSASGTALDRDERIHAIESNPRREVPMDDDKIWFMDYEENSHPIDEIAWLDNIVAECAKKGFIFPQRLIYAFHTSLKTAEYSPLTVLSGVSGTGKSELPRLYSLFGGLNFFPLPVQPNWDSQEAMLGFFNAVDNVFDAQPILRFLAQTQLEATPDYPFGLKKAMSLILLDEMNLAHVELYFADFLSKFELRRGYNKSNVPCLDIKLGAGMPPYPLPLDRNVLWVGTMNQDETTKSLSDKVIDRGIILHFPRPSRLYRRVKIESLKSYPDRLLPRKAWADWRPLKQQHEFERDAIGQYKNFVEQINEYLGVVGRALGHRVWQSIEAYMINYPTVRRCVAAGDQTSPEFRNEIRKAFEDQLVQKVMPKLRGIETHGHARENCLDRIGNLLEEHTYSICEDFQDACTKGYGQFIWNSAKYLESDSGEPMEEQA